VDIGTHALQNVHVGDTAYQYFHFGSRPHLNIPISFVSPVTKRSQSLMDNTARGTGLLNVIDKITL